MISNTQIYCPLCQTPMVEREGRFGLFWGCSRWPDCKFTYSAKEAAQIIDPDFDFEYIYDDQFREDL